MNETKISNCVGRFIYTCIGLYDHEGGMSIYLFTDCWFGVLRSQYVCVHLCTYFLHVLLLLVHLIVGILVISYQVWNKFLSLLHSFLDISIFNYFIWFCGFVFLIQNIKFTAFVIFSLVSLYTRSRLYLNWNYHWNFTCQWCSLTCYWEMDFVLIVYIVELKFLK